AVAGSAVAGSAVAGSAVAGSAVAGSAVAGSAVAGSAARSVLDAVGAALPEGALSLPEASWLPVGALSAETTLS
ncbi:MAG: hypothetical protein ACK5U8_33240, partial [Deltaproteobacteria bacterium]